MPSFPTNLTFETPVKNTTSYQVKVGFLSGFSRQPTSQKTHLRPASTEWEVGFLSGFSKVGF